MLKLKLKEHIYFKLLALKGSNMEVEWRFRITVLLLHSNLFYS